MPTSCAAIMSVPARGQVMRSASRMRRTTRIPNRRQSGQQRGYDSTTGQPAWVAAPPPTIEQRITALSVLRFEHEVAGVYYRPASQSTAVLFPTDRDTQNKLTAANYLAALGQLPSVNWKTNVTWALLTSAEVQTLFNIVVTYVTRCYEYENHLADLIHAGAVVDITIGWPLQGP
jgi:hypothetical protein